MQPHATQSARQKVSLTGTTSLAVFMGAFASLASYQPAHATNVDEPNGFSGNISWYGAHFNGKKTASGEIFDMNKPTAAHKKLPFQTKILVEDPKTGKSVVVKVNDRGPFVKSRVMDVSREGARKLGTLSHGVTYVDCTVVDK
jgi:rare lipoprotein A (peptidoglycan hydrolase)